jgi:hypothetical protein
MAIRLRALVAGNEDTHGDNGAEQHQRDIDSPAAVHSGLA